MVQKMGYKRRFTRKKKTDTEKSEVKKMGKIKHKITIVDGIKFHSKMESEYYEYLKELKAQGIVKDFKLQPEFILQDKFIVVDGVIYEGSHEDFNKLKRKTKVPTVQAIKYISDFEVEYANGEIRIVDTKGQETADFKIKKKMFAYKYPHLKLDVIIFDEKKGWIPYDEHQKDKRLKAKEKKLRGAS